MRAIKPFEVGYCIWDQLRPSGMQGLGKSAIVLGISRIISCAGCCLEDETSRLLWVRKHRTGLGGVIGKNKIDRGKSRHVKP